MAREYQYIDKRGKTILQLSCDEAWRFASGLASVRIDNEYRYINILGQTKIKLPKMVIGYPFSEDFAIICDRNGCGYIDKAGSTVIKPKFDMVGHFSEGLALAYKNGLYGYIDKTGEYVIKPTLKWMGMTEDESEFSEGLARVAIDDLYGYLNRRGKIVIKPRYSGAGKFSEGVARVEMDNKLYYIDAKGAIIIDIGLNTDVDFDRNTANFSEGLASVFVEFSQTVTRTKWIYIDHQGKTVIEADYDHCAGFSEGLARVFVFDDKGGKWGFIDKSGKLALGLQDGEADDFSQGVACVSNRRSSILLYRRQI